MSVEASVSVNSGAAAAAAGPMRPRAQAAGADVFLLGAVGQDLPQRRHGDGSLRPELPQGIDGVPADAHVRVGEPPGPLRRGLALPGRRLLGRRDRRQRRKEEKQDRAGSHRQITSRVRDHKTLRRSRPWRTAAAAVFVAAGRVGGLEHVDLVGLLPSSTSA